MTTLTRFTRTDSVWPEPGEWCLVDLGGVSNARLGCPSCGLRALLNHEIDAEGNVTPSVDCPECEYHETGVVLEGWTDA